MEGKNWYDGYTQNGYEYANKTESVNSNVDDLDTQGRGVASAAVELKEIVGVFKTEE